MKRSLSLLSFLLLGTLSVFAQEYSGKVVDAKDKSPLPYVNVGVLGKSIGTVSGTDGSFKLSPVSDADSVKISMVGYKPKRFLGADLKTNPAKYQNIALEPDVVDLKDVKVKNRKWKEAVLGNTTKSKGTNAGFNSNKLGNEIGIAIKIKRSPTIIKKFNASLSDPSTTNVKMRLNFYTIKDGLPDQLINNENIFVTVKKGDEAIDVDLTKYNIVAEDKFFVSLEWIETSPGRIMFSASLLSSFISRSTSQAAWEKVGMVGIGFNVLAEY